MTISTIRTSLATVACAVATIVTLQPDAARAADDAVNPHWNKSTCQSCHVDAAPTADNLQFQTPEVEELCKSCHDSRGGAKSCRHSSGIPAGDQPMPDSYRDALVDGRLACTTCHDLAVQCNNPTQAYSYQNPGFIRDRTSRNTGEHCFECHDATAYEQFNPHAMEAGNPAQPTCTFCHTTMPLRDERGWISADVDMPGSLNDLCRGCHRVKSHPGSMFSSTPATWNHLAVPSAEILARMKYSEETLAFIFPLDPSTGEIYCATCHNPHHEDLEAYPVPTSPGMKYRLRVDNICQACHDM